HRDSQTHRFRNRGQGTVSVYDSRTDHPLHASLLSEMAFGSRTAVFEDVRSSSSEKDSKSLERDAIEAHAAARNLAWRRTSDSRRADGWPRSRRHRRYVARTRLRFR